VPVSPARRIAFDVLREVAAEDAYASELLYTRMGTSVARADAGLATEITLGVLRWQRLLDFLLQQHLDRAPERLDLEVLLALRLGLYQLRFLERVPAHAAVSESVELVKRAKKYSAASLVNAVLRRAVPQAKISGSALEKLLPACSPTERLAILNSHPTWLVERWMTAFGRERTVALLEANNRPPRLCCAILDASENRPQTGHEPENIAQSLRNAGLEVSPGRWLRSALTISGGNPTTVVAFQQGQISFQDEASQMVAHLVDAQPGRTVLDLCAAPGGKTILLARMVGTRGQVIATDLHEHRLRSTREQLTRTHTSNVRLLALDASRPVPFAQRFDHILVDAPCSGTGTLARNPEIRWRLKPEDLGASHRQQVAMLRNAVSVLSPGGRLVYSTCSLEAEENEQVVTEILSDDQNVHAVKLSSELAKYLLRGAIADSLFDTSGRFRTFPPDTATDGFFAALLQRTDAA
jgi:16S rRNA (cytosine967-C5)-methyltransferase